MTLPRLSVALGLWQNRPADEALRTAAAADEYRYDELWIGEMATYDAFALATAVGSRTRAIRLTLGPFAVSVRDPMMLAMGSASVADLVDRPVSLAIGTSSPVVVEQWHGRARQQPVRALEECLSELRRLVAGEPGTGTGAVVRSRGYHLRLAPPRSTLTVAGFGRRALRLAAVAADRVVLSLVTVEVAAELARQVRTAAREAGRVPPPVAAWVPTAVDGGRPAADQVRSMLVGYLAAPGYAEMFARAGHAELVNFARTRPHPRELLARIPEELVTSVAATGTIEEVRSRLRDYGEHLDEVAMLPSSTDRDPAGRRTLAAVAELR